MTKRLVLVRLSTSNSRKEHTAQFAVADIPDGVVLAPLPPVVVNEQLKAFLDP